ncbi:tyrosine-type recombinase/integrase [Pseudanabaena sp. ABRG5-3]|uniref:tyrosine-type recombinase/integrase n=1 Tax=Pseudanabaena sp. ABRG5-3 TaxID=685565 RepID=UPI000DC6F0A3|nr:site-specific integrase [Pseudanabaena sp. ABRG5-3]BBC24776.1 integrase family protein [Pseudanabaena sp. ABRG5-3]
MGKNNRFGQAEILNDAELDRIFKHLKNREHKLFFAIARYSGERFGAIAKLKISDVYGPGYVPLDELTFPANIRKASPNGDRSTRQVMVFERFAEALTIYKPRDRYPDLLWLFPSSIKEGKHISWSAADKWLRAAVERAGLSHRGISGHSLRRSFITKLYESGMDIHQLQQVTGHKSISVLQKYIGKNPVKLKESMSKIFA